MQDCIFCTLITGMCFLKNLIRSAGEWYSQRGFIEVHGGLNVTPELMDALGGPGSCTLT